MDWDFNSFEIFDQQARPAIVAEGLVLKMLKMTFLHKCSTRTADFPNSTSTDVLQVPTALAENVFFAENGSRN